MKKDFTRDYITEVFRLYAAMGKPTHQQASEMVYEKELFKHSNLQPQVAITQAEKAVENNTALLLDILAAERTIRLLEQGEKEYIVAAVKAVYFAEPKAPIRKGDVSARVRRFSLEYPVDERTAYRWLKEARLLCAALRGLRIETTDTAKYRFYLL